MNDAKLHRATFRTSRELDFLSQKELVTQTGHEIGEWPLVIIKELVDNALDACEEHGISPVIEVRADASGITVVDNGPGLPETTLAGAMDFTIRVSNREAYVSPCRGAQGNALKTLIPMASVINPADGRMIITTNGKRHEISCGADPISQRVVVHDDVTDLPKSKNDQVVALPEKQAFSTGTEVRLEWGSSRNANDEVVWPFGAMLPLNVFSKVRNHIFGLVEGFALFNPHATFRLNWFGEKKTWSASNPNWTKWRPDHPTSPHWYEPRHLERLVGAYISHDREQGRDRLVSDFVAEFDGLSGSGKRTKILNEAGLKRAKLSELVVEDRLDGIRIAKLLIAMQRHTRPVKAQRLGIIGEDHFRQRFLAMGIDARSFRYSRQMAKSKKSEGSANEKACCLPWVLEAAFGWLGESAHDSRKIYAGANWSAAIKNPFRTFGTSPEGLETILSQRKATSTEPIVFAIHVAHPRIEYTDRGKSAFIIGDAS